MQIAIQSIYLPGIYPIYLPIEISIQSFDLSRCLSNLSTYPGIYPIFFLSRYLSNLFPIQITVQSFYLSRCIPNLFGMGLLPARDFHDFARCSSIYSCYMSNKLFQNIYNLILDKIYFQRF